MKNTFKRLAAAITLTAATSTVAAADDENKFHISSNDFNKMVRNIGCDPVPERLKWLLSVPEEEQPYTRAERLKSARIAYHCGKYNHNVEPDIAQLLIDSPEDAILALRAVPEAQKTERNTVARAAAIDMARKAIDFAMKDRLGNHRDMPRFYNELNALLDEIPTEPVSFDEYMKVHPEMRDQPYKMQRASSANYIKNGKCS